jgi:chromosome segregation ATPase
MDKDSIDLMNVDYEDVLQLYKGLRKSETVLKDKNRELAAMKLRVQQLQESHSKFRGQIQALESVKELTVTLQSQLSMMQHELKRLETDNNELTEMNNQAEMIIKEKTEVEERQNRMLAELQIDFSNLKDRYEEKLKFQKELEKLIYDEQSLRRAAEVRASTNEETRDDLREENRQLKMKLDNAMLKLGQCDHELAHASEQLIMLSKQLRHIPESEKQIGSLKTENTNLKADIARLIRLVEYSPAKRELADMWNDSGGLVFVGMGDKNDDLDSSGVRRSQTLAKNTQSSAFFDLQDAVTGEDTAGLAFTNAAITAAEFAQMKRLHGGDPFPLSANISVNITYYNGF